MGKAEECWKAWYRAEQRWQLRERTKNSAFCRVRPLHACDAHNLKIQVVPDGLHNSHKMLKHNLESLHYFMLVPQPFIPCNRIQKQPF